MKVHLHNGILHGSKKEETLTFYNNVGEPGENYAKWIKPVSESSPFFVE